ncbi:MAG: aminodeoxychorismate/anthranilate synthase component II [Flavobacteriales bacterium]|nr:aminodeoxychorismate/anthranilate synthase component II [Flavobacteriales bacterium]
MSTFAKKQNSIKVKVLIVDFYDSFTYNLAHYFEKLDCEINVVRNDELDLNTLLNYDKLVLSPGPGLPREKQNLFTILEQFSGKIPILGICLGMQAIGEYMGGSIQNQSIVKHGVAEKITITNTKNLFQSFPDSILVGLYHSWEVVQIPKENISSISENKVIMAIEFPEKKLFGVQFHPESILTENGLLLLRNFLNLN